MANEAEGRGSPIGVAGAGRVGLALARLLQAEGEPVTAIASRSPQRSHAAAELLGDRVLPVAYAALPLHAGRFLIAVPDGAIADVADVLASSGANGIALHTSGAVGLEALSALAERGVACGTLHPLQTVTGAPDAAQVLSGVAFSIWGDPAAVEWAQSIAKLCGGTTLRIEPEARAMYHAAAVMAGNYVTALVDAAACLMEHAGVERETALRALAPLVRASAENALTRGPVAALTGPIERGDTATVMAHLIALERSPTTVQALYRAAGLHTLGIARRKGLGAEQAARLEREFNRK
ncbi:MAG TPA: Rossmann-like and DUF2520 domain-containing protein [Bryobacteraceae bacterium]|nr:Rossmann-like and DUF2520 domain-containing protein [Bryobacteraceae bacterium]